MRRAVRVEHAGAEGREFPFKPARVIMQDFTGVPAIVDLAAMRDAMADLGGDPQRINPVIPVDLVIDHSVQVDLFASSRALRGQRVAGVPAQPRALRVPPLGSRGLRRLPRRAARHGHRAPGEPRVPGARRARCGRRRCVSRHPGGNGLPHADDQRHRRAGLGRRRHRGGGRAPGAAAVHADPRGGRDAAAAAACGRG